MFFKTKLTEEQKNLGKKVLSEVMEMVEKQTGSDEEIISKKHELENNFGFVISGVDKPTAFIRNLKELMFYHK